jgi:hypothetical protein
VGYSVFRDNWWCGGMGEEKNWMYSGEQFNSRPSLPLPELSWFSRFIMFSVRAVQSSVHSGQKSYRRLLNEQLLSLYCLA